MLDEALDQGKFLLTGRLRLVLGPLHVCACQEEKPSGGVTSLEFTHGCCACVSHSYKKNPAFSFLNFTLCFI